jgi:hypothetical protein
VPGHADAVFGAEDPPWRRLDAKTRRDIVEECLRGMTILAHGSGRPTGELLAEIAAVNDAGTQTIRLMSHLMPGEAMVHALVTQVLLDWCATASGQTRSDVLQRLALTQRLA